MKITYLHRCKKEVPKQLALASANGGYFAVRLYPVCLIDGKWNEEESALCPARYTLPFQPNQLRRRPSGLGLGRVLAPKATRKPT